MKNKLLLLMLISSSLVIADDCMKECKRAGGTETECNNICNGQGQDPNDPNGPCSECMIEKTES